MPNKKNFSTIARRARVVTATAKTNRDLKVLFHDFTFNRSKDYSKELLNEFYEVHHHCDLNNQATHEDKLEQARFYVDLNNIIDLIYAEFTE